MENPNNFVAQPWTAKVWLLLTVISFTGGSILTNVRLYNFPLSWFVTMCFVGIYRFLLINKNINQPISIFVVLGVSLFLQSIASLGETGWRLASLLVVLSMLYLYNFVYSEPIFDEYYRLIDLQPDATPRHPHSPVIFEFAVFQIWFVNELYLLVTVFYPSSVLHAHLEECVGLVFFMESFLFLWCYNYLNAEMDGNNDS